MKKFTFAVLFTAVIVTITGCFEQSKTTAEPVEVIVIEVIKYVSREDAIKKFQRELPDLASTLMGRYRVGAELIGISSNELHSLDVAIMGSTSRQAAVSIVSHMAEYASLNIPESEFKYFDLLAKDSSWIRPELFEVVYQVSGKSSAPLAAYLSVKHEVVGPHPEGSNFKDAFGTISAPFIEETVEVNYVSYEEALKYFSVKSRVDEVVEDVSRIVLMLCVVADVDPEELSVEDKLAVALIAKDTVNNVTKELAKYSSEHVTMADLELLETAPEVSLKLKSDLWDVNSKAIEPYLFKIRDYLLGTKTKKA